MKQIVLSLTTASLLLFTGCESSSSTETQLETTSYDITVERGPVIGAFVIDNDGKRGQNIANGVYRFETTPSYPITTYGGYIDVNRDGVIDANDTALTSSLELHEQNRSKITIATTLAANEELKNQLLTTYGLSEDELYDHTPSTLAKIAAISDQVFKYCIQNNISVEDINTETLASLESLINEEEEQILNSDGELVDIVSDIESSIVQELNISLSDENLTQIETQITQSTLQEKDPSALLDSMDTYEISEADKNGLIFMYQEEKVARDVYLHLYNVWGTKIFNNIASSEQQHMDAVKAILEKYELTVPSSQSGVFENQELQELYDTLIAAGEVSQIDALKVGVLVEETDIDDLLERIEYAPEDIKVIYQSLLNGSYNHLNAFNNQL